MIEEDFVKVIFSDGEYHLAPHKGKNVDRALFSAYIQVRELLNGLRAEIKSRINRPKDKPMTVAKNHPIPVEEGEIVKFD